MRRLVWVSLGAAGGILAYRKSQEMIKAAQDKGVLLTVTDTAASLKEIAQGTTRYLSRLLESPQRMDVITGEAAAEVRSQTQR